LIGAALLARGVRARRRIDLHGRSALVTGGSRGLGLLIARELGSAGAKVTITARDPEELERARRMLEEEGIDIATLTADMAVPAEATGAVEAAIAARGKLDILVNNAGVIKVGPLDHMTLADFEEAMAVHLWGPLHTMRAAVPHMRERGGGRIANISSIGGKIGVCHLVPYSASKFALTGLSTAARAELVKDNIHVTTVSPGLMRTGSPFNAWFKGQHRREFAWFAISDSLPVVSIDARRAAAQVVNAIRYGDAELVVSWPAKLGVLASAAFPEAIAFAMSVANRLLPSAVGEHGDRARSGWQSTSSWSPSILTKLSERPALENNELPSSAQIIQ
jgi:NAD(P)-dependent dehydrogenase (short-subunit alcohol dehydrogenase family)